MKTNTENLFEKDCIRTFTGQYVNVLNPNPDTIVIEDIAHSLSMQCRFGGHLSTFYSVSDHSIVCSKYADDKSKLKMLMHDASEAYLLDIPSPVKKLIPEYYSIENNLMLVISKKFGFDWPMNDTDKKIDMDVLQWEWSNLMLLKREKIDKELSLSRAIFINEFNLLTR